MMIAHRRIDCLASEILEFMNFRSNKRPQKRLKKRKSKSVLFVNRFEKLLRRCDLLSDPA